MPRIHTLINNFNKLKFPLLIAFAILLHLIVRPIFAQRQNPWFSPDPTEHQAALEECKTGNVGLECTVQAVVSAVMNSLNEESGASEGTTRRPSATQFAGGLIIKLIAYPPVSSGDYVQYVAQKITPVQPAYAQDSTGYRALSALIQLWTAMRNVAYLAFVVIFIFIGFMIMFRAQINPQTVIGIQNALPKLVVTLLLVTFSYAIAGLMVDLIYLGIFLAVSIFASQGLINNPAQVRDVLIQENLFTMAISAGFFRGADTIADAVNDALIGIINQGWFDVVYDILTFGGSLVNLIIRVAIIFSLFKLFFQLLIAYINIIVSTVLAPIMILFNALPNSQSFSNWARNFLSNVILFPAVAFLFLMSAVLIGRSDPADRWQVQQGLYEVDPNDAWTPPFIIGGPGTQRTLEQVIAIIGLGFILFAPQMVTMLQQALKTKPLPTAGVFAPIAAGARVAYSPFSGIGRGIGTGARVYLGEKIERVARRGEGSPPSRVG
jgi:hypothetical protein